MKLESWRPLPSNLTVTTPATVSITDDDSATLRVMGAPLAFDEDVGAATVTLELTNALSGTPVGDG